MLFLKKYFTKYGLISPTSKAFLLLLTKLVSSGFHWETSPSTRKVPTDLACLKVTSTQVRGLHRRVTKGASLILIWVDSRSSGFIMSSTFFQIWRNAKPQGEKYSEKSMKGLPSYDKNLVLCEATCHPLRCQQGCNK
jgi:hypothetical protein